MVVLVYGAAKTVPAPISKRTDKDDKKYMMLVDKWARKATLTWLDIDLGLARTVK